MRRLVCTCGTCHRCKNREYMRAYRAAHPTQFKDWYETKGREFHRERQRRYREEHREQVRQHDRDTDTGVRTPRDPAKVRAQNIVQHALRRGRLKRQPCEVCGAMPVASDGRSLVEAHHDDYSKPLEVRWLCSIDHGKVHRAA